ncbi:hypothetical protein CHUAL_008319 [Chamberlinius hualienensis]
MELKRNIPNLITLCLLSVISTVSPQCCNDDTPCSWSGNWHNYPSESPETSEYPNFWNSATSSSFYFIQNVGGTETSVDSFYINIPGQVLTFDYFFDSPFVDKSNYLKVYFQNVATGDSTLISTVNTTYPVWVQNHVIVCDASVNYCCGVGSVPCNGKISVSSTINPTREFALFAFSNIGTCNAAPTVPTIVCCDFDVYNCAVGFTGWTWGTNPAVAYSSGQYLWTDMTGVQATFPIIDTVLADTVVQLSYYITGSLTEANVWFYSSMMPAKKIGNLFETPSIWNVFTVTGVDICEGLSSCTGQIAIETIGTNNGLVAIDNVVVDGKCIR